jgi:hypothetical protein
MTRPAPCTLRHISPTTCISTRGSAARLGTESTARRGRLQRSSWALGSSMGDEMSIGTSAAMVGAATSRVSTLRFGLPQWTSRKLEKTYDLGCARLVRRARGIGLVSLVGLRPPCVTVSKMRVEDTRIIRHGVAQGDRPERDQLADEPVRQRHHLCRLPFATPVWRWVSAPSCPFALADSSSGRT